MNRTRESERWRAAYEFDRESDRSGGLEQLLIEQSGTETVTSVQSVRRLSHRTSAKKPYAIGAALKLEER